MKSTLNPPPERSMPPGRHDRRRAELVAILDRETRGQARAGSRRRFAVPRLAVPLVAAATVGLVTVGVTIAIPALRDSGQPPSASSGVAPPGATAARIKPAPAVQELSAAQVTKFRRDCEAWGEKPGEYNGHTTVTAFRFPSERRFGVPAAWLVLRKGAQYTTCLKDGTGAMVGTNGFGPDTVKDIPFLYALVDGRGQGSGPFTRPVARVTIQGEDGAEREAVLRHGFWFASYDDQKYLEFDSKGTPTSDNGLIGVPFGYTIRGYDKSGARIYDSSKNGPSANACYTDPGGKEVLVHNGVKNPTPEKCRRTLRWVP